MQIKKQEWNQPESQRNPIDVIQTFVEAQGLDCRRPCEEEIAFDNRGSWAVYQYLARWQEEHEALHTCCMIDIRVPEELFSRMAELVTKINARLWAGNFELMENYAYPAFRYVLLLKGVGSVALEQVEELLDLAFEECDRYFPAFQLLIWGGKSADEALADCLADVSMAGQV